MMTDFETILQSHREEDVQRYLAKHKSILIDAFGGPWDVNECIEKFRFGNEFVSDFVIISG